MTIALTGASGFVGRHVLRALRRLSDDPITCVGRHPPDVMPVDAIFVQLDLATAEEDDYRRIGEPDLLVHLAWGGLPNYRSLHHYEAELPAQYRFLATMVRAGLPAMLVTGTCYEYGMVDGEMSEDRAPAPANPYAFAKAALLRQLRFLQTEHPFALAWARLFYMWGEGQAPGSLYPLLKAAAARSDALFPMSAGEQLRDYLPVERVADLIATAALARRDIGVVNISSGSPISIRSLVERWIADEGLGIEPEFGRYPYPDYEPLAFWGSTAKRIALFG